MKGDVGEQSWFSKFEAASHQGTEDYNKKRQIWDIESHGHEWVTESDLETMHYRNGVPQSNCYILVSISPFTHNGHCTLSLELLRYIVLHYVSFHLLHLYLGLAWLYLYVVADLIG